MPESSIRPFKIDILRNEVDRLKAKLADTRLPGRSIVPNARERYEACETYDWYEVQHELNTLPQYLTEIEGTDIHFLHAQSPKNGAIPLLMIHGWPGSFWEFSQVWSKLSNPEHEDSQPFDVVVPNNARIFDNLMSRLGYERCMVQCCDWSYFVSRELGAQYTDRCKLLHLNFAQSPFPEGLELTEREEAVKARADDWLENHMGYAVCMRSRIDAIQQGIQDLKDKLDAVLHQPSYIPTHTDGTSTRHAYLGSQAQDAMPILTDAVPSYTPPWDKEENNRMAMTRESSPEVVNDAEGNEPVTLEEPTRSLYEVTKLRNIRSNKAKTTRAARGNKSNVNDFMARGIMSEEESEQLYDVILSQVHLTQILSSVYQRFSLSEINELNTGDGLGGFTYGCTAGSDAATAVLDDMDRETLSDYNSQIDQWRKRWYSRQPSSPFIGEFTSGGVVPYSYFAKLQVNSFAVRGISASYGRLSMERRELANIAVSAAVSILTMVLKEEGIRKALVGTPLDVHTMITFASVFLMKATTKRARLMAVTSERHLIKHIAVGLVRLLGRLVNGSPGERTDGQDESEATAAKTSSIARIPSGHSPATTDGMRTSIGAQREPDLSNMTQSSQPQIDPLDSMNGWISGSYRMPQADGAADDPLASPPAVLTNDLMYQVFGSDSTNNVYHLLSTQFQEGN
ncbi:alpha/beta-hydrolase [Paramyrothecium foliicola]|nr:alpha/beta-hydrolase [Paramyrothecium foliicola]